MNRPKAANQQQQRQQRQRRSESVKKRRDVGHTRPSSKARAGRGQRGTTPKRTDALASSRPRSLGGEQVEGRHAVRELLLAGTRRTREVFLSADLDDAPILSDIIDLADEHKVPIRELAKTKFDAKARTETSQGVVATAAPLRPVDLADLLESSAVAAAPFLLLLDQVTDPRNLGAILRTAECAGVTGIVLPRHRAAHITPSVTKAAAGAIEHLRMSVVGGLPAAMQELRDKSIWLVGLDSTGSQSIHELSIAAEPLALVLGSEGKGLSRLVRARCDIVTSIPLSGSLSSLNVSAAAAIACFKIQSHRSHHP